jgi:hypothetical protein
MRSIRIDLGPDPIDAPSAIDNVRFAAALLGGAAEAAETELAAHAWSPVVLAAAGALGKIIRDCNAFEAAVAGPAISAVDTVHMPEPATLATIATVEAVRATMPSPEVQKAIAAVSAVSASMPRARHIQKGK